MGAYRGEDVGSCDKCAQRFRYLLIHSGFNDSSYAYCDSCCYIAILDHWTLSSEMPVHDYGRITPEVEPYLIACPSRGAFRAAAGARCPHCNEPLDAVRAADYIEAHAAGTAKGWRWQRSWTGIYCIVLDERVVTDACKPRECI